MSKILAGISRCFGSKFSLLINVFLNVYKALDPLSVSVLKLSAAPLVSSSLSLFPAADPSV